MLLLAACGTSSASGTGAAAAATARPTATSLPTATKPPATARVKITEHNEKYDFEPATLTITVGTTVVWTNTSDAPHIVSSDSGPTLQSTTIKASSGTFSHTFAQAGTYSYHCTIHPYMKGTIVVTG